MVYLIIITVENSIPVLMDKSQYTYWTSHMYAQQLEKRYVFKYSL